jgi:uncharacterized membrane protein
VSAPRSAPVPPFSTRVRAETRATRAVLAVGTVVSVACFMVALALEFLERPTGGGEALDLGAVVASALAFERWGWATLGVFAVIVSPIAAVAATAAEYALVGDRRTFLTALLVLAVLALSLLVSLAAR